MYTFACFLNPDEVTFRARLQGTAQASSSQLVNYIEQWSTTDVTIAVQGLRLRVDSSCSIAISSFSDPECETEWQQPTSYSNLPAIIGGGVAGVVALTVSIYNDLCCYNNNNKKTNKNIAVLPKIGN